MLQMSILSWIKGKTVGSTMKKNMEKLEDFGYYFDKDGALRNLDGSGEGFTFQVYSSQRENQLRYECLGNVVDKHVFQLLEEEAKLQQITIPVDGKKGGKGFIFASSGYKKAEKLLLLVHGSGVVRAGQWSRRLIINNSLNEGSQLPYIEKAKQLGFGVLVLNSNQNYDDHGDIIQGSETPEKHFHYVWKHFVASSKAEHVAIVAHSYGGVITVHEAVINPEMRKRTFAVAFTDSVHGYTRAMGSEERELFDWMNKRVCNWVSSRKPLDERLHSRQHDCVRMSAGTPVHEETSWKAFDSVWRFIEEKLSERLSQRQDASVDREKVQNPRQDASKLTAKRHDVHQQEIDKGNVRQSRVLTGKSADVNNKASSQSTISPSRGKKRSYANAVQVSKTSTMKAADGVVNNVKKRIDDKCSPGGSQTNSERAITDTCEKKTINSKVDDVRKDTTSPVVDKSKADSKVDNVRKEKTSPVVSERKAGNKIDNVRKDTTSPVVGEGKACSKVDDVNKDATSPVVGKGKAGSKGDDVNKHATSPVVGKGKAGSKGDDVNKDATSPVVGKGKAGSKGDDVNKDATSPVVGKGKAGSKGDDVNKDATSPVVGKGKACSKGDDVKNRADPNSFEAANKDKKFDANDKSSANGHQKEKERKTNENGHAQKKAGQKVQKNAHERQQSGTKTSHNTTNEKKRGDEEIATQNGWEVVKSKSAKKKARKSAGNCFGNKLNGNEKRGDSKNKEINGKEESNKKRSGGKKSVK